MKPKWTKWPEATGAQFVNFQGTTWIGVVEISPVSDPEGGQKLTVWRGPNHYTIWPKLQPRHGLKFQQIVWPEKP